MWLRQFNVTIHTVNLVKYSCKKKTLYVGPTRADGDNFEDSDNDSKGGWVGVGCLLYVTWLQKPKKMFSILVWTIK